MDAGFCASLIVCGLSQAQADALAQEGYLTYEDFSLSSYEDILDSDKKGSGIVHDSWQCSF